MPKAERAKRQTIPILNVEMVEPTPLELQRLAKDLRDRVWLAWIGYRSAASLHPVDPDAPRIARVLDALLKAMGETIADRNTAALGELENAARRVTGQTQKRGGRRPDREQAARLLEQLMAKRLLELLDPAFLAREFLFAATMTEPIAFELKRAGRIPGRRALDRDLWTESHARVSRAFGKLIARDEVPGAVRFVKSGLRALGYPYWRNLFNGEDADLSRARRRRARKETAVA